MNALISAPQAKGDRDGVRSAWLAGWACAAALASGSPCSASPILGPTSLVTYNWRPASQLPHFRAALAAVRANTPGASARIVAFGDSTTEGINADNRGGATALNLSYPADLMADLAQITGLPAQNANFQGEDIDSGSLTFYGPGFNANTAYSGLGVAGGNAITTTAAGQGFTFTLSNPGTFDTLNVNYFDSNSGSVTVTVIGGPSGQVSQTLQFANSGNMRTQAVSLPRGTYVSASVTANGSGNTYLEGVSFSNSKSATLQMVNAGIGGAWSSAVGNGTDAGPGDFPGGLVFSPSLALLNFGINDILDNVYTPAQTVANFRLMVLEARAVNCDPVIVIPQPFSLNPYLPPPQITSLAAVRDGLKTLSLQYNVPIIDLSATYGDSAQALSADDLLINPHPDSALYADIAARIAVLLTGRSTTAFPVTASYLAPGAQTVSGTHSHDILFGSAPANTLVGNGGADTYVMRATDQQDNIVNGLPVDPHPLGQLDVTAADHLQLWLSQSGNDLVVTVLGTTQQAVIKNWFAAAQAQLKYILGKDQYKLGPDLPALLAAMAAFDAANPGFNPQTTPYKTISESYYGSALNAEAAQDWSR